MYPSNSKPGRNMQKIFGINSTGVQRILFSLTRGREEILQNISLRGMGNQTKEKVRTQFAHIKKQIFKMNFPNQRARIWDNLSITFLFLVAKTKISRNSQEKGHSKHRRLNITASHYTDTHLLLLRQNKIMGPVFINLLHPNVGSTTPSIQQSSSPKGLRGGS